MCFVIEIERLQEEDDDDDDNESGNGFDSSDESDSLEDFDLDQAPQQTGILYFISCHVPHYRV